MLKPRSTTFYEKQGFLISKERIQKNLQIETWFFFSKILNIATAWSETLLYMDNLWDGSDSQIQRVGLSYTLPKSYLVNHEILDSWITSLAPGTWQRRWVTWLGPVVASSESIISRSWFPWQPLTLAVIQAQNLFLNRASCNYTLAMADKV